MDEIIDREADRQAAADQKRRDRSEEGPKEADSAVAQRMIRIRRPLRSPEGETEQQLVVRIRDRMRGLGESAEEPVISPAPSFAAATTRFAANAMIRLKRFPALRLGRMLASEWRTPRPWGLVPRPRGPEAGPPFTGEVSRTLNVTCTSDNADSVDKDVHFDEHGTATDNRTVNVPPSEAETTYTAKSPITRVRR
jgi:hypothetical protein